MKKIILAVFSIVAITNTAHAEPKLEYPTQLIGTFMQFCVNVLGQRMMYNGFPQAAAIHNSSNVCSCIMDEYRSKSSQAEFEYEFHTKDHNNVVLFKKYMDVCIESEMTQAEIPLKESIIYQ